MAIIWNNEKNNFALFFFQNPDMKDYFYNRKIIDANTLNKEIFQIDTITEMYADFLQQIKL